MKTSRLLDRSHPVRYSRSPALGEPVVHARRSVEPGASIRCSFSSATDLVASRLTSPLGCALSPNFSSPCLFNRSTPSSLATRCLGT